MMASRNFFILLAAIAIFLPPTAMATKHWVGGKIGWTIDNDYKAWAKDKVFYVGDTLVFVYNKTHHNVYKANQTEYQNCTVPKGKPDFTSGFDNITLAQPGKKWYICGFPKHCSDHKQKLAITVMEKPAPAPAPMPPMPMTPPPAATPDAPGKSAAYGTQQASRYQLLLPAAAVALAAFLMA